MKEKVLSRREFLKRTGAGAVGVGVLPQLLSAQGRDYSSAPAVDKKQLISALGDTIIPVHRKCPGYKSLERHGITDEVLKELEISQQECNIFNAAAGELFNGKSFMNLNEAQRTEFLEQIANSFPAGSYGMTQAETLARTRNLQTGPSDRTVTAQPAGEAAVAAGGKLAATLGENVTGVLQKVFRLGRNRVLLVFYRNFPQGKVERDKNRMPVLKPGDEHQIINPNTKELVTGWDVANFPGPLSWAEEESYRAKWMKIHWHND